MVCSTEGVNKATSETGTSETATSETNEGGKCHFFFFLIGNGEKKRHTCEWATLSTIHSYLRAGNRLVLGLLSWTQFIVLGLTQVVIVSGEVITNANNWNHTRTIARDAMMNCG